MAEPSTRTASPWADTIDELAEKIGVDVTNMMATVRDYNKYAESGIDIDFGKPGPFSPIATAPFYAVKFNIIRHTPAAAFGVNSKGTGILTARKCGTAAVPCRSMPRKVIPHLYAAGEVAAFVGFRRAHRKTGPILSMGRICGRQAAAELPS